DHFYYMCTKWFSDGDVHKYFNPYGSPYEAYINYMNVLADFHLRLQSGPNQETIPAIITPGHKIKEAITDQKKPPSKKAVKDDKKTRKAAPDMKKPGKAVKKRGKK
ncbi:MAG: alpha-amylase, partial [Bacteroidales bacterium]|nr:alpha-amylase [Bacteroidales bacterium]